MMFVQVHKCGASCRQGRLGRTQCRMAYARAVNPAGTRPVFFKDACNGRVEEISQEPGHEAESMLIWDSAMQAKRASPFRPNDFRLVTWELGRSEQDGNSVAFPPVLMRAVRCNIADELLTNHGSAIAATFYTIKYVTKGDGKLANVLSCLVESIKKTDAHPSRADDAGTPQRIVTHHLQSILNSMSSHEETPAQMMALCLMAVPSVVFSTNFAVVDVVACKKWLVEQARATDAASDTASYVPSASSDDTSESSIDGDSSASSVSGGDSSSMYDSGSDGDDDAWSDIDLNDARVAAGASASATLRRAVAGHVCSPRQSPGGL